MHKAFSFNVLYVQCKSETPRFLDSRNIFNYVYQKPNILQHKQTFKKNSEKNSVKEGGFVCFSK